MELLSFTANEYKAFILILTRIGTILFLFPFFGSPSFPPFVKAGLSLALTVFLFPVLEIDISVFPDTAAGYALLAGSELLTGLVLSFCVRIFVAAVQTTGQIAGFQLGFSMINVMDPQSGSQVSVLDQLFYWAVLVMFIGLEGHHLIITSVVESFAVVKPGSLVFSPGLAQKLIAMPGGMFVLGVKMAAPIIALVIFTDAAFGIMTKFAPQMNILTVAFPVKIIGGLFMSAVAMPVFLMATKSFVSGLLQLLRSFLAMMGGN